MTTALDTVVTALTVAITFDDFQIGELQNLTASENYGVTEVYGVGSPTPDFIPGLFKGALSARRGFVDVNAFFTKLQPWAIGSAQDTDSQGLRRVLDEAGNFLTNGPQSLNSLFSNFISVGLTQNSYHSPIQRERFTKQLLFDVKVFKNITVPTSTEFPTGTSQELMTTYKDCIIDTRRMTIDSSTIIIIEDLTLKYRIRI